METTTAGSSWSESNVIRTYKLEEVIDWLQNEAQYKSKGHNALTLGRDYPAQEVGWNAAATTSGEQESATLSSSTAPKPTPALSNVIVCLQKDQRLHEHNTPGPFTLTLLRGRIIFILEPNRVNSATELTQGQLLILQEPRLHEVVALEDSAFLLTITLVAK